MRNDTAIETTMLNVRGFRMYVALEEGSGEKEQVASLVHTFLKENSK